MTLYGILVPLGALVIAGVGIAFAHLSARNLDRWEREERAKHPAE